MFYTTLLSAGNSVLLFCHVIKICTGVAGVCSCPHQSQEIGSVCGTTSLCYHIIIFFLKSTMLPLLLDVLQSVLIDFTDIQKAMETLIVELFYTSYRRRLKRVFPCTYVFSVLAHKHFKIVTEKLRNYIVNVKEYIKIQRHFCLCR